MKNITRHFKAQITDSWLSFVIANLYFKLSKSLSRLSTKPISKMMSWS
jgi:hypothetical protein